jgi:autotransporter strand-loop-strand O-heptosyltransferase
MKILQVNPGWMEIPTKNWGAVEKVIYMYSIGLRRLGHDVDILKLDEVDLDKSKYDIVHVHMWNHALTLHEKGIPFVYSMHDHHAHEFGQKSSVFSHNMKAIQNASVAFVHSAELVEEFNSIPVFLPHCVDRDFYYPLQFVSPNKKKIHSNGILCVGNNGFAGKSFYDRKGFKLAVEVAKTMKCPISICGPSVCNKEFFEHHKESFDYDKLTIHFDLDHQKLRTMYQTSFALLHMSESEAGHPPLTLLEAAACGLPIVSTSCNGELHTSVVQRSGYDIVESDVFSIVDRLHSIQDYYSNVVKDTLDSVSKYDLDSTSKLLNDYYLKVLNVPSKSKDMGNSTIDIYKTIERIEKEVMKSNATTVSFVDGALFEVTGNVEEKFVVKFIDSDSGDTIYTSSLTTNHWAKPHPKYFVRWYVQVEYSDGRVRHYPLNLDGKKVYISFESSSLGDTLAWIPCVEKFATDNSCDVVVSTFWNSLFESKYPSLKFVKPGTTVSDVYASYKIGIFYDGDGYRKDRHKTDFRKLPLQQIASDILGVSMTETLPRISYDTTASTNSKLPSKYVCIANHSTAQAKYWNNPTGWQEVVDYVKSKGYEVVLLSKEDDGYMGNKNPTGVIHVKSKTIQEVAGILNNSSGFIGISSGLSWLAWALQIPTVVISGFTTDSFEPTNGIIRVGTSKENVCSGCWERHYFDRGDWNWCPDKKGTTGQFECSVSIESEDVISRLNFL